MQHLADEAPALHENQGRVGDQRILQRYLPREPAQFVIQNGAPGGIHRSRPGDLRGKVREPVLSFRRGQVRIQEVGTRQCSLQRCDTTRFTSQAHFLPAPVLLDDLPERVLLFRFLRLREG